MTDRLAKRDGKDCPEQRARREFEAATAEHEMTVLRDDGLYRHVRFAKPGTSIYFYDLVTWPGHLVICGDVDSYHFARIADMFQFFDREGVREINPHYWSEKLQGEGGRREIARCYTPERFEQVVRQWLADQCEYMADSGDDPKPIASLRAAVEEQLFKRGVAGISQFESEARELLRDFEHEGRYIADFWKYDLREWRPQFLWACWAITLGIERYNATREAVACS